MRNIYILHKRISDKYLLIYKKFSGIEQYKVIHYTNEIDKYNDLETTQEIESKNNDFLSYIYKLFR